MSIGYRISIWWASITKSWHIVSPSSETAPTFGELLPLPVRLGKTSQFYNHASFSALAPVAAAHESTIKQLKFLLNSAPLIDTPPKYRHAAWFKRSTIAFGYMHPITMAQYRAPVSKAFRAKDGSWEESSLFRFIQFSGSPTKWVLTSLMPQDRVLFSPSAIPGLEKILAGDACDAVVR